MANNISKINLPNDSNQYDIVGKLGRGLVRATKSSTSTSTAFDLTADGITELYDGLTIWFRNDATASASGIKLNLNNLGLKNVYRSQRNTAVTTDIEANAIHLFVYELANDRWVKMEGTYTSNSDTMGEYGGAVVAGGGNMARYSLIMQTQLDPPTFASLVTTSSTGTSKAKQTCGFLPNGKVLYQNVDTYAEGGTAGQPSIWTIVSLDLRYSFNISSTTLPTTVIGKAIYIKCTMSNGLLYLADTTWWATDLPSTQDNFYYVYVGQMYSRYQCTLYPVHPIYYHDGTKIVEYSTSGGTDENVKQTAAVNNTEYDILLGSSTTPETGHVQKSPNLNYTHFSYGSDLNVGSSDPTNGDMQSIIYVNSYSNNSELMPHSHVVLHDLFEDSNDSIDSNIEFSNSNGRFDIFSSWAINDSSVIKKILSFGYGDGTSDSNISIDTTSLLVKAMLNLIYPVGSIYISVYDSTADMVQNRFGGTWEAWGAGRVPVGVDTTQTEFNTVQKTGGNKTVTLTAAQSGVPAHAHATPNSNFQFNKSKISNTSYGLTTGGGFAGDVIVSQNTGTRTSGTNQPVYNSPATNNNTAADASQAHTNLQPYITCYMWRRTA